MRSATARRPRSRRARARLAAVASATGALLLAVTVVWQSASAGFTDSTAALRATAGAATITLTDDDAEGRLFTVTGLKPGDSAGTRCIVVRSTNSTVAPTARTSDVRLYVTGATSTRSLASWLNVGVRIGTGGGTAGCTGFQSQSQVFSGRLADLPADSWSNGRASWSAPAAGQTRTYEITVSLDQDTPLSAQGGTAGATFVWESRFS
ncbi:hypothetical protein O2W14_01125 [Modestobacter sp. VKM Ac-2986]|uniref:hypothetical protein n=1 Tax=Modestobacter sp. VKM Ac-2986 TaxID=3004140 RepID=UPI0022AA0536|nr:hypothetical protein [Modestobacter sp. VKM Ac-2986]MCZ2827434.1 hypothetical protein [Modestobacter sp. VKM Ac-2986]